MDGSTFAGIGSGQDSISIGSGDGGGQGGVVTERVQALASSVYREFAQVVNQYGEGPVTSLMPIVITVLESLDGALSDLTDSQRALEEATEDNEQLHAQYEKEKQIRRDDQAKHMHNEDLNEDERRELRQQLEQVATYNRQLKAQLESTKERADRGEEKIEKIKNDMMDLQVKNRRMTHLLQQQKNTSNVSMARPRTYSGGRHVLASTESPSPLSDPAQVTEVAHYEVGIVSVEDCAVVSSSSTVTSSSEIISTSAVRHGPATDEIINFRPPLSSSPVPSEEGAFSFRTTLSPSPNTDQEATTSPEPSQGSTPAAEERHDELLPVRSQEDNSQDATLMTVTEEEDDNLARLTKNERLELDIADEEMLSPALSMHSVTLEPSVSHMGESLESELMQASKSMTDVDLEAEVSAAIPEEEEPTAQPQDQPSEPSQEDTVKAVQVEETPLETVAAVPSPDAEPVPSPDTEPVRSQEVEPVPSPEVEPVPSPKVEPFPSLVAERMPPVAVAAVSNDPEVVAGVADVTAVAEASVDLDGSDVPQSEHRKVSVEEEILPLDDVRIDDVSRTAQRPASIAEDISGATETEAGDLDSPTSIEMDLGADDLEIERLMQQVRDLETMLDQKITQNTDIIGQLSQVSLEREILQGRMESASLERSEMQTKLRAMEAALQERSDRVEELEKRELANQEPLFPGTGDENFAVKSGRQYTRVEMSRLLRERNEFKERYLSLKEKLQILQQQLQQQQDATTPKKKEKTLWKMFSDMFKGKAAPKSTTTPGKAAGSTRFAPLRTQDSISSQVSIPSAPAALTLVGHRFEAYGWSLPHAMAPQSMSSSSDQADATAAASALVRRGSARPATEINRLDTVPVLMHCGHLVSDAPDQMTFSATRTWCAAAVCSTEQSNPSLHPSDTVCPSSLVWVCTGTSELSRVSVVDANMPGEIIDSFPVCSSPILCIASVPGVEDDENMIHIASASEDSSMLTPSELEQYRYRSPTQSPQPMQQISPDHFMDKGKASPVLSPLARPVPTEKVVSLKDAFRNSPVPDNKRPHSKSLSGEAMARPRLRLPTMWMGAEFGCLYIHSAVNTWRSCLHAMKVEASVLSIVYAQQKVFVAMANSGLAIFGRDRDEWDWEDYKVTYLGHDRDVPISVMVPVKHRVWCGVGNKVYVVDANTNKVETHFKVHPSVRSRVLSMVTSGDGVWISVRLDSTLRLFHADTFQNLQDVDVAKPIQTLLTFPGSKRKPSPRNLVRISTLLISNNCLWIGASNGTIVSLPLTNDRPVEGHETPRGTDVGTGASLSTFSIIPGEDAMVADDSTATAFADTTTSYMLPNIPYISLEASRLSFHGHIHNVDILVATPGVMATRTVKVVTESGSSTPKRISSASVTFVISIGGGYVDFRSDSTGAGSSSTGSTSAQAADRNHLIVWQVSPSNSEI